MLTDFLQNQAAHYASGAMTSEEREPFDLLLEFHGELRDFVAGLVEVGAALTLASLPTGVVGVPSGLKARITSQLDAGRHRGVWPRPPRGVGEPSLQRHVRLLARRTPREKSRAHAPRSEDGRGDSGADAPGGAYLSLLP